jgi:hypothetical protein
LQPFNRCLYTWVCGSNLAFAKFLKQIGVDEDGKLGFLGGTIGKRTPLVDRGEVISEGVESGAEVMQAVPDEDSDLGRRLTFRPDPNAVLASLRVELTHEEIRVSSQPPMNFSFQAFQVLDRPL